MPAHLRLATPDDAPSLARFHRLMFAEMAVLESRPLDLERLETMESACSEYFRLGQAEDSILAWVVETQGEIAACGAVTIRPCAPVPASTATRQGHLHSVYTLPAHRRQGYARWIVKAAVDWGRAAGLQSITLNASPAGRALYEALGFHPAETAMILGPA